MKRLSIAAFVLTVVVLLGEFADGYFCTRTAWLLVGPIDLLCIPAAGMLGIATISSVLIYLWSRLKKKPVPPIGWRWQAAAMAALALLFYGGFDPRLAGLSIRARTHESALIDFCSKYRAGGTSAVADHQVLKWGISYKSIVRSNERFVEVSWGSALPRSWGIRISDLERPVPEFVTGSDESAMAASARLTVFIGLW